METLRNNFPLKSSDLRKTLDLAPATMNEIFRKSGTTFVDENNKKAGAKFIPPPDVRKILETRGFEYPKQAKIVSFMICKGGTGKTTCSFFMSQRISAYGGRVLVIDADPQGNLTAAFALERYGFTINEETPVLVDVFTGESPIEDVIVRITSNLHLIPSTPMNSTLDSKIRDKFKNPSLALKSKIKGLLHLYDYILIDCAPALNLTNTAMVSASDLILLPVNPDTFSQIGLDQTLEEIQTIERDFSFSVETKIIFTRFDAREFTSIHFLSEIVKERRDCMFKTIVKTSSEVKNVITRHEDLFNSAKSTAKDDFDSLTKELMGLDVSLRKKPKKSDQPKVN